MTADYSGTPLARKLGIAPGSLVWLARVPADLLGERPPGAVLHRRATAEAYDVIVACCNDRAALAAGWSRWRARLAQAGGLWIGWPKKASGVETDLSDIVVRDFGLAQGLVDNKVAALDATWSGIRFVIRLADRT